MDFLNLHIGCWTSTEASQQMSSDMIISRTSMIPRQETLKGHEMVLKQEETAKCLHDASACFSDVSKKFSIAFNISSANTIELFRQNYYNSLHSNEKSKDPNATHLHDPTRIFFNNIDLCIDCMLKIFAQSPLSLLISSHFTRKTYYTLSANVSWLKLLSYPPMLKRMIKYKYPYKQKKDEEYQYLEYLFFMVLYWSEKNEDSRIAIKKDKTMKDWILSDDDVKYILVRYTLIFVMGIMKGYFNKNRLEILWKQFISEINIPEYDIQFFRDTCNQFNTFCDSIDLKLTFKLCINLFIIAIQVKYHNFFQINFFQISMINILNNILAEHRKNRIECHCCHKYTINIKLCKGCKIIYYCSKRCQKKDWIKRHRLNCKGMKKLWWTDKWDPVKCASWSKYFHLI